MTTENTLKNICFVLIMIGICLAIILGLLIAVNQEFKAQNEELRDRVTVLENNLYDINVQNLGDCWDKVRLNNTCDIPNTIDANICPQFRECDKKFAEVEKLYNWKDDHV